MDVPEIFILEINIAVINVHFPFKKGYLIEFNRYVTQDKIYCNLADNSLYGELVECCYLQRAV